MGYRRKDDYLPLLYRLKDGEPETLLPYETFSDDGVLTRVPRGDWDGIEGFGMWLRRIKAHASGEEFGERFGVDEALIRRWIAGGYMEAGRWVALAQLALSTIDRILTLSDEESLWTLYPYLDDDLEVDTAYCVRCREDVMPVDDVCPWCDTPILRLAELPAPREHQPRPRRKRTLLRTVRRPRPGNGGWEPIARPVAELKPTEPEPRRGHGRWGTKLLPEHIRYAAEAFTAIPTIQYATAEVESRYGLCGYSSRRTLYLAVRNEWAKRNWETPEDVQRALATGDLKPPTKTIPRSSRLTEAVIYEAAFRYYICDYGFDRLSKLLFARDTCGYKTYKSLSRGIYDEFKYRGWPRRDRIEATRQASFKHGLAPRNRKAKLGEKAESNYRRWLKHERKEAHPRCRATVRQGKRKGKRCARPAVAEQKYCVVHMALDGGDELRARRSEQLVAKMHARSRATEIPSLPLAVWLESVLPLYRTHKAMSARIAECHGGKPASRATLLSHIMSGRRSGVRRETAEKIVSALAQNGETVESLYAPLITPPASAGAQ